MRSNEELSLLIQRRLKRHRRWHRASDGDYWTDCAVLEQFGTRVAPPGEWLGTEEGRQRALKEQTEMDKLVSCEFCDLCGDLKNILTVRVKR